MRRIEHQSPHPPDGWRNRVWGRAAKIRQWVGLHSFFAGFDLGWSFHFSLVGRLLVCANDTAHRLHQTCGQVFRYAVASGRALRDVTSDLRGALRPNRHTHFASLTEPTKVGEMLRTLDSFSGTLVVGAALRPAPMVFVRPGELRKAEWSQVDFDRREWRYTLSKTKTEHLVPLADQAVEILRELHALTGRWRFVFPGRDRRKPMSGAAINAALQRLGFDTKTEITGHGFRAMARTILHERLRFPAEVIELQLGHRVPDNLGTAYNRAKFLDDRIVMMQCWADYLGQLKKGVNAEIDRDNKRSPRRAHHFSRGAESRCLFDPLIDDATLTYEWTPNELSANVYLLMAKVLRLFARTLTAAHTVRRIRRFPRATKRGRPESSSTIN